jgi:hypothetical protein
MNDSVLTYNPVSSLYGWTRSVGRVLYQEYRWGLIGIDFVFYVVHMSMAWGFSSGMEDHSSVAEAVH